MQENEKKAELAVKGAAVALNPELLAVEGGSMAGAKGTTSFSGADPKAVFSADNKPDASTPLSAQKPDQDPDGIVASREKGKEKEDEFLRKAKAFNDKALKEAKKHLENLREPHQPAHDLNSLFDKLMFIFKKSREEKTMRAASKRNSQMDSGDIKEQMDALQTTSGMMNTSKLSDNASNIKNSLADMARQSDLPNMLKYPLVGAGELIKNIVPDSGVELGTGIFQAAKSFFSQASAASAMGSRNVNKEPAQTNSQSSTPILTQ